MSKMTKGAQAFDALCDRHDPVGEFMSEVSDRLGVSIQNLYRWRTGDHRPSPKRQLQIQRVYGIQMELWAEDAEPSDNTAAA